MPDTSSRSRGTWRMLASIFVVAVLVTSVGWFLLRTPAEEPEPPASAPVTPSSTWAPGPVPSQKPDERLAQYKELKFDVRAPRAHQYWPSPNYATATRVETLTIPASLLGVSNDHKFAAGSPNDKSFGSDIAGYSLDTGEEVWRIAGYFICIGSFGNHLYCLSEDNSSVVTIDITSGKQERLASELSGAFFPSMVGVSENALIFTVMRGEDAYLYNVALDGSGIRWSQKLPDPHAVPLCDLYDELLFCTTSSDSDVDQHQVRSLATGDVEWEFSLSSSSTVFSDVNPPELRVACDGVVVKHPEQVDFFDARGKHVRTIKNVPETMPVLLPKIGRAFDSHVPCVPLADWQRIFDDPLLHGTLLVDADGHLVTMPDPQSGHHVFVATNAFADPQAYGGEATADGSAVVWRDPISETLISQRSDGTVVAAAPAVGAYVTLYNGVYAALDTDYANDKVQTLLFLPR